MSWYLTPLTKPGCCTPTGQNERDREQEMKEKLPAHATRLLEPYEEILYLTRPRMFSLGMVVVMTTVILALAVFSIIVEPGFIRLLALPACPLLGGIAGRLLHTPVIFVTDRRIVFARRFLKPLSHPLEKLVEMRVRQNRLGRLLGQGDLFLFFTPPQNANRGFFQQVALLKIPDVGSLSSAISSARDAIGKTVSTS